MKRALLILLALAGVAYGAGAPVHVPFVARLADGGMPITGNHNLIFEIYANETGGIALWSEKRNSIAIPADGVLYLELGDVTPFPAGTFDGTTRYLQITIDNQTTTTRIPVDSAPYAISANSATTATTADDATMLGGKPASAYQPLLNGASCTAGHFLSSIDPATGTATCMPDTVYGAGSGLVLVGNNLAVDPAKFQARVTGTCGPNAAIASINQDGTVNCQSVPTYSAGNGLTLVGTQFSINTSQTQARIAGSCSTGFAISSIDASGNVTCQPIGGGGGGGVTPVAFADGGTVAPTSSGSYADLGGPSVTATIGASGKALVTVTADANPVGGAVAYVGFTAGSTAANDNFALITKSQLQASATFLVTGLSAGSQTFKMEYKFDGGGGGAMASFSNRHLVVTPL